MVLVGFIAVDLLLIVPAYASELRLDRLHPSLPIVNLRPLAAARARITDGLGEEFTAPVRKIASDLQQAGAKALNAILHEAGASSGDPSELIETATIPNSDRTGIALMSSPTPSPSSGVASAGDDPAPPSPIMNSLETSVVETATALALPPGTETSAATVTQIASYTPTIQSQLEPTMTPSRTTVVSATATCVALLATSCQATASPISTPTPVPTSMPTPTLTYTVTLMPIAPSNIPAFPEAEGWGAESVGGRGGQVIEVTNLNNGGPGSLRACAQDASGPRICVFRVAGEIVLTGSRLKIRNPYLTIAGQTAPGGGITLRGGDSLVRPIVQFEPGVHDVIVRYLTVRAGQGYGARDAVTFRGGHNIILDHVSLEWATDEIVGMNPNAGETVSSVTIQRSIVAETFRPHSTGMLITGEDDLFQVTLHHNLFAHNGHRNPRVNSSTRIEVINNVVYNWHNRVGTTVADAQVDFIGNYFKAGPWSAEQRIFRHEHVDPHNPDVVYPDPSIYAQGNLAIPFQPDASEDNWNLFRYHYVLTGSLPESWHRYVSVSSPHPVTVDFAQAAYDSVLADVGNNARLDETGNWILRPDVVDRNIISDVIHGTGPAQDSEIDHEDDFGGYPAINPGTPYDDSDHDGMADEWEGLYCFDPNDPSDGPKDADGDGYTNVEEFLNGTQPIAGADC